MNEAYIVDVVRLPRAAINPTSAYAKFTPIDLLKPLFEALTQRQPLDPNDVEDVLLGCSTQSGEQGANLGKIASLYAGWPNTVSGVTVSRFCCSGQDAINLAAAKIMSGMESLLVAGGVEQLSRVPMFSDKGAWFSDPNVRDKTNFIHMGMAADLIAVQNNYVRNQLDQLSFLSHERAWRAIQKNLFSPSLVTLKNERGVDVIAQDNSVRNDVSMEGLSKLRPAFNKYLDQGQDIIDRVYQDINLDARHSVANAPALVDGASLVLLGSKQRIDELGLKAKARVRYFANASDDSVRMLTGHIRSTQKLLKATGLKSKDIGLWEVNESFCASLLFYQDTFDISWEKLNINGGAIALGHPLGATGGNLLATLIDSLEREDQSLGIISICGGAGVGTTTLVERV